MLDPARFPRHRHIALGMITGGAILILAALFLLPDPSWRVLAIALGVIGVIDAVAGIVLFTRMRR
jgi:hypothetical protein